ncbi:signal peptidase II [Geodermatophilus bullaregiensis]|uniref:signal peptidase II n=1 Tax=Geodermatophilus bullaregiensis TaxID=1564160 RepID=UPI0027DE0219|nr:signal peptidase II [Geodermatophilus bullaregiensis]MBM7804773.1 signal peptidase II [Geodermatophilus bullaregiensis]
MARATAPPAAAAQAGGRARLSSGTTDRPTTSQEPALTDEPEQPGAATSGDATPGEGTTPGTAVRRPRTRLLLLLAALVLLADLGSKLLVVATIDRGEDLRVLGGLLYLTHARNTGAAFSFAEGFTVVFTLIAVAVAAVIVRTARRLASLGWAVALGLVLGGAVGNLVDRVFREPGFLRGGVVDFLSVFAPDGEVYPIFNVADSAIVCGGVLGAVLALRGIEFDGSRSRDHGDDAVSRG